MDGLEQHALILDDDDRSRRLLTLLVQALGVSVTPTGDFQTFQSELRPSTGLVILDLTMPDVDGVEVIRHLSLIGFRGRLTIVSGAEPRVLESVELLARRSGLSVTGWVRKPFSPLAFQRHLQAYIKPEINPTLRPRTLPVAEVDYLLGSGALRAHYQPKVSLVSGRIVGLEALARCDHPTLGVIGPGVFFKSLSKSELAERFNERMFKVVFSDIARWQARGPVLPVAINLSAESLANLAIPDQVFSLARRYDIDLNKIVFEITETTFSEDMFNVLDVLTRLRLKGVGLSIDDFGTGYSTEERLTELPFTELKIDRSLVVALDYETGAADKVERCVKWSRRLGLTVVAEGVETDEQMALLCDLGVDAVQGFALARPMPAMDVPGWVQNYEGGGAGTTAYACL